MKIVAKHKYAPLVALENGSVVDTEDLEVIGSGDVSGPNWEFNVDDTVADPRWIEIARADSARLSVNEKRANSGERTFRAPRAVRDELAANGVDTPLAAGSGLTLQQLEDLIEQDGVQGLAFEWAAQTLNKHQPNPMQDHEDALFAEAEPHLDYEVIDSATDGVQNEDDAPTTAVTVTADGSAPAPGPAPPVDGEKVADPPPGQFNKIVYFAIVEQDDTESVQDLIALVQTPTGAADAYSYEGGSQGWKEAAKTLFQLQSPAPPPIQDLQPWQVNSITKQIDGATSKGGSADNAPDPEDDSAEPVQASAFELAEGRFIWGPNNRDILSIVAMGVPGRGGADPAQRLRDYWQTGEGGAKIRWNTPGDWKRCHRHLSKYLGVRAAGYCQLMHKRMTGVYTGSRFNVGGNGHHAHASLITSDTAEFNQTGKNAGSTRANTTGTRKSTSGRTTNSTVNGSRNTGTGNTKVSVPTGQHYVSPAPTPAPAPAANQPAAAPSKPASSTSKPAAAPKKSATPAAPKSTAPKSSTNAAHSSTAKAEARVPKGQSGGGRFAPGNARGGNAGSTGKTYKQDQADPHNQDMYNSVMGAKGANQKKYLAGLSNGDLQSLTGIAYSSKSSDPTVVAARIAIANEMAKRGFDVKDYGALGGGSKKPGAAPAKAPIKAPAQKSTVKAPVKAPVKKAAAPAPAPAKYVLPTQPGGSTGVRAI